MSVNFADVNNGGANAGNSPYLCAFGTASDDRLLVLFMMSNVNSVFGATAPRTVLSVTDNLPTVSGGAMASLPWQQRAQLLSSSSPDGNGCFMSGEIWTAPAPKAIAKNNTDGLTQVSAQWSVQTGGGTCSMLILSLGGLNINSPLDPGSTLLGFVRGFVNTTTAASAPTLDGFDQANINDLALLFYMTDDARHDFFTPSFASGTFLIADNEEGVGVARSRTGLQYSYFSGPGHTSPSQPGVSVGPAMALGLLFSDGVTPPPIFRARPFIIQ